jgi:leucyl aminopeptidase
VGCDCHAKVAHFRLAGCNRAANHYRMKARGRTCGPPALQKATMSKSLSVRFASTDAPKTATTLVYAVEPSSLAQLTERIDAQTSGAVSRAVAASEFKAKAKAAIEILAPHNLSASRLVLLGLGDAAKRKERDWVDAGGFLRGKLSQTRDADIVVNAGNPAEHAQFALGLELRNYSFKKYKGKSKPSNDESSEDDSKEKKELETVTIFCGDPAATEAAYGLAKAVGDGVAFARDLVNEPANILTPHAFAARLKELQAEGLSVEVLDQASMKQLGMGALLGVSQGSAEPPFTVILRWNGTQDADPNGTNLVLVGKGVTFDTGGISIKPAAGMEDMKGDMAGAAAVAGTMLALARRKAKARVAGIVGLVENMPSATAQRPGDIVTSASGQTIEVLNTDAEGRLVLADILWYAQNKLKPKAMITLATLTGAILIALGKEHAGLFSNDDALAGQVVDAGLETGEPAWRLPLSKKYNKLLDSKIADMKNIGGREAGSITAAQFLQRFVDKGMPWAHLDIAGTAFGAPSTDTNSSWASGYGVRLLDRLVAKFYEQDKPHPR